MIRNLLIGLIRLYQKTLSRVIGPVCRFEPSCSAYAVAVIDAHGVIRGSLLSAVRLCKCHPFHPGGYDPPPPRGVSLRACGASLPLLHPPRTLEPASPCREAEARAGH